uniref:Uncharacterized protein n=1 Tax=Rhizophora mucronata TaxID=61149 RepID=A0A2P2QZI0_RHIMU
MARKLNKFQFLFVCVNPFVVTILIDDTEQSFQDICREMNVESRDAYHKVSANHKSPYHFHIFSHFYSLENSFQLKLTFIQKQKQTAS